MKKGSQHKEETKALLSKIRLGVKKSEETRKNMSIAKQKMTDETKEKMSVASKGKPKSEAHKQAMREAHRKRFAMLKERRENEKG